MLSGSCHCGAVTFALAKTPDFLTDCNCSICRRLGGLWAHAPIEEVTVTGEGDATFGYVWGDRGLAFHTCRTCGCTTHWQNLRPEEYGHMAVNCRLCEPEAIAALRIRHFDGADSWTYLD